VLEGRSQDNEQYTASQKKKLGCDMWEQATNSVRTYFWHLLQYDVPSNVTSCVMLHGDDVNV
jgi:hypothetical protein